MENGTTDYSGMFGGYYSFMDKYTDPRTSEWFLVKGYFPLQLLTLLGLYVYFCTSFGPNMMKSRKPFQLRKTLLVYNAVNVVVSVWLIYETLRSGWWNDYSLTCQPVDYSDTPRAMMMANAVWLYYMCKLMELMETVFFVLRKKNNQVSYLHLYHHLIMPFGSWLTLKFVAGGHMTFGMPINAFVHMVMYTYYLLAALGPQYQKYLWWKKYLTKLQLIQFVMIFVHALQVFFTDCSFPRTIATLMAINATCLFALFGTFYVRTYLNKSKKA